MKVNVSIKDTELFVKLAETLTRIANDERIDIEVRNEHIEPILNVLEQSQSKGA